MRAKTHLPNFLCHRRYQQLDHCPRVARRKGHLGSTTLSSCLFGFGSQPKRGRESAALAGFTHSGCVDERGVDKFGIDWVGASKKSFGGAFSARLSTLRGSSRRGATCGAVVILRLGLHIHTRPLPARDLAFLVKSFRPARKQRPGSSC